jgi:hypothetical protein
MEAIAKLIRSGLTRKQIALTIGLKTPHLIGLYAQGKRFPTQKNFRALVDLADSRGILLLARDFLVNGIEHKTS